MAVQEVTRTIEVVVPPPPPIRESVVFWSFPMTRNGYVEQTYYMATMEDLQGRLWASFYSHISQAVANINAFAYNGGELAIPWGIFSRAAERLLAGETAVLMKGKGRFIRRGDSYTYVTACHIEYGLTEETLRGLLA